MRDELALSTDAPLGEVVTLLMNDPSIQAEVAEISDDVYWLRTRDDQVIAMDTWPKLDVDELETFISVEATYPRLQEDVFAALRQLPYESRQFDSKDEETVFRPEGALPAQPWHPE